ncbi:hypothetical protein MASR1M45_25300 [Candidatus Kapaibacterium sp.]
MKYLKLIFLIVIFLFFASCSFLKKFDPEYWKIKSDFKKELEFIQKILDNPDKIREIIESSEFYDKRYFNFKNDSYKTVISYLKNENNTIDIIGFYRTNHYSSRGITFSEGIKLIVVYKDGSDLELGFYFLELDKISKLIDIVTITK